MAKELNVILDQGEAQPAVSCIGDSGSVPYLEQVVSPIYETMVKSLTIIAFNNGRVDRDAFKEVLSIGPTFAVMCFIES
ncbi:hypothetical protein MKX03_029802 [Papaver bracteatum]|nr:hypothetical protein MKX03_029802 [Papaver bracteatum]